MNKNDAIAEMINHPDDAESLIFDIADQLTESDISYILDEIYEIWGNDDEYAFVRDTLRNNTEFTIN